ncbi:MAG: endonuclease III [Lachnospiraceae bacterium]|nr:endonuclease III [Lachnospiraceae bacterium]MBR5177213.1 endonuclease III [Lachnospiraceae bacterium]
MTKKERINNILATLDEMYPDEECSLDYGCDWQLLFATILSAQCTDARVNIITKDLYKKYPDLNAFASADIGELEQDVKPAGYFRSKAKHIKECAGELLTRFEGKVPRTIEELTSLPGVGRKTANVIRTHIYHDDSIVVDTHVKRISRLLGLTDTDDAVKAEFELMKMIPKDHWSKINLQMINHGRNICISGRPKCSECRLSAYCKHFCNMSKD